MIINERLVELEISTLEVARNQIKALDGELERADSELEFLWRRPSGRRL
jgi:hypothetical protein